MNVPYHRYWMAQEEEAAALRVLRSGWLTTGAETAAFESEFCTYRGGGHAAATTSCTTAMEILLASLQLEPGSEVIVGPLTFVSTIHAIVHQGLVPVLADVLPGSALLDPEAVAQAITPKTKVILPIHVAGHPCRMDRLADLAEAHGLFIIEDCAHALEGSWQGRPLGSWGYGGAFSFYANKNMTTGEGGMAWVQDEKVLEQLRLWRNHGLDYDSYSRDRQVGPRFKQYDILLPGYKYAMSDLQAALGRAQLDHVPQWHMRRTHLAERYTRALSQVPGAFPFLPEAEGASAWHLYVLRLEKERFSGSRDALMHSIMARGVNLSLHFKPVHLFDYYQKKQIQTTPLPQAEAWYESVFSLPLYPLLSDTEQDYVIDVVVDTLQKHLK